MNLKGCGRKRLWPNLRYYSGICMGGLKKQENLQERRSQRQNLNPGPQGYEGVKHSTTTFDILVEIYRRVRGAYCVHHRGDCPYDGCSTHL
jgi:hypothetical protein